MLMVIITLLTDYGSHAQGLQYVLRTKWLNSIATKPVLVLQLCLYTLHVWRTPKRCAEAKRYSISYVRTTVNCAGSMCPRWSLPLSSYVRHALV
jgi:hypothetical protein